MTDPFDEEAEGALTAGIWVLLQSEVLPFLLSGFGGGSGTNDFFWLIASIRIF